MSAGKFRWLLAGAAFVAMAATTTAQAATVSCPGTAGTGDREFGVNTTPNAVCLTAGVGNINGNNDAINQLGYVTLDKTDAAGLTTLTVTGVGGLSGNFSFVALAGYYNYVIAFKSGQGQLDPDWAAFTLSNGVVSGLWAILNGNQSLSHANLYAQLCPVGGCPDGANDPGETPIPGAVLLFGSVLAGGVGIMRRRKKVATSA